MLERSILCCLLAFGLLAGLGPISEMISQKFNTAGCAIRSYEGCIQPAQAPQRPAPGQHRFFSVDAR